MPTSNISVLAFVDWNSQIWNAKQIDEKDCLKQTRLTFKSTAAAISSALAKLAAHHRYIVSMRLYHGWYKGFEPMPSRKAITTVIAEADFSGLSVSPRVVFNPFVGYGDRLLSALDKRLNMSRQIHLPGTVRERPNGRHEEKMVDTAMVCDVLTMARTEPQDWMLIVAEDYDMVPAIFGAEAWLNGYGGRTYLLRSKPAAGIHCNLDGLQLQGRWL